MLNKLLIFLSVNTLLFSNIDQKFLDSFDNYTKESYESNKNINQILKLHNDLVRDLMQKRTELKNYIFLYWYAYTRYIYAEAYRIKNIKEQKNINKQKALDLYLDSINIIERSLKNDKNINNLTLASEIYIQYSALKGIASIIKNNIKIQSYNDKAQKINKNDWRVIYLNSSKKVFAPKIFGGSFQEGIKSLKDIYKRSLKKLAKYKIALSIYNGYLKKDDKENTRLWKKNILGIFNIGYI